MTLSGERQGFSGLQTLQRSQSRLESHWLAVSDMTCTTEHKSSDDLHRSLPQLMPPEFQFGGKPIANHTNEAARTK